MIDKSSAERLFRVDLHTHTRHSRDSVLSPVESTERARAAGLDRLAITDHNAIDGALEAAAHDPGLVIVGEEIDCAGGAHVIGLFLRERIPPHLSVAETAERIRDQDGIIYAPHPFAYLRSTESRAREVLAVADIVEVFNARAFVPAWNRRALAAARAMKLPCAAGTDSHLGGEIGRSWTELPAFDDAAGMRAVLERARPVVGRLTPPRVHFISAVHDVTRRRRVERESSV
jgi:predicted metal-dependent phosphoesterase TrpH